MNPQLQRRIQRYGWDKAAPHYERYWEAQLAPARERLLAAADLQRGERVLDVACGTGLVAFGVAEAVGPTGLVTATDLSDAMVNAVVREAESRGTPNVRAMRMDAESLLFPDGSFDVALCALGLMYVPDPLASLREMARVLRAGGRMAAVVWGERARCGWAEIFPIVDARVQSEVCPMFFALGAGATLAGVAVAAGYREVGSERVAATLHYDSAEDAVGAAFAGGPVALAYSRFDPAVRDAAHAEYLASIAPYRRGSGYEIPGEFVVVWGRN